MNDNKLPTPALILAIYDDGTTHRADMSAADLRGLGQYLSKVGPQFIAVADNAVIRGTMPQVENEQVRDEK